MAQTANRFGEHLRTLREQAGLTQEGLAERAGLSAQAVAALESGRRQRPHPSTVQALAGALGLSEEDREALTGVVRARATTVAEPPHRQVQVPPTPLIGREREVGEVRGLLCGDARVVTLTGPGGVGKTRLALEVASHITAELPDGALFVTLAPVGDPALVLPTLARALGVSEVGGQPLTETLHSYLQDKRLLLVLDNFEQLLDAAPDVAGLIASCPGLRVLATSRAPLRVRGEHEYPVRPLPVPGLSRLPSVGEVAEAAAVRLFVDRARSSSSAFELTQANAAAVAAICRRLEGLPLAIELAAARIRALSPTELLARLDQSLPLLTGGARDLPERQRTMRKAIEWSYQLLDEPSWRLLNRLSVFRGGWDLEAAEAVGASGDITEEEVLDLLSSLVEQSLVLAEVNPEGSTRYRMLVPVREYAEERLEQSGEAEEVRRRHAEYFLSLAERAEPELRGADQVAWLERLAGEHDNMRVTLSWLIDHDDTEGAARLGWYLARFWWMRGHLSEGRRWMEAVLARDAAPSARAWALMTAVVMAFGRGDLDWAATSIEESLELFRCIGDEHAVTMAMSLAGLVAIGRQQYEHGVALVEEALRRYIEEGDSWGTALLLSYFAAMPQSQAEYARAEAWAAEALSLSRETGDRLGIYASLYNLASVAQARGCHSEAARLFGEALELSIEMGDRSNAAYCMEGLAGVAVGRGDLVCAARLWGAAEALLEGGEAAVYPYTPDRTLQRKAVADARSCVDEQEWEAAWEQGRAMTLEEAVEYALEGSEAGRAEAPLFPG